MHCTVSHQSFKILLETDTITIFTGTPGIPIQLIKCKHGLRNSYRENKSTAVLSLEQCGMVIRGPIFEFLSSTQRPLPPMFSIKELTLCRGCRQ